MLDLSLGPFQRTGTVYYHIGTPTLQVQRHLGILTSRKILLVPPPGQGPFYTHASRRFDEYQSVAHRVPAGLGEQRSVEHGNLGARGPHRIDLLREQPPDFRMGQLFQIFSFASSVVRIGEDDARQPRPIDLVATPIATLENIVSEVFAQRSLDPRQAKHVMARTVGVQQPGSQPTQCSGNRTLAACYAAEYADYPHAVWISWSQEI